VRQVIGSGVSRHLGPSLLSEGQVFLWRLVA
jgi:hypothetical protein